METRIARLGVAELHVENFALADALSVENDAETGSPLKSGTPLGGSASNLDMIVPGTSVADLLGSQPGHDDDIPPELLESD